MIKQLSSFTSLVLAFVLAGCTTPVEEPDRAGFISDYSKLVMEEDEALELTEDEAYSYVNPDLVNYRVFIIEDITMLYEAEPDEREFTDEELQELADFAKDVLAEALTEDGVFKVVDEPGPGVALARMAITSVDETIGALNVSTYSKITGLGLGGASIEGEILDSVTGEQLFATIRWGGGSRVGRAGYSKTGDARIILTRWAKELREKLEEMHGIDDS